MVCATLTSLLLVPRRTAELRGGHLEFDLPPVHSSVSTDDLSLPAELGDSSVDHTWLWRLSPRHGSTLEADEYVDSVRFRLGCAGPAEPTTCAACNSGILDTGAAHASCCALGEATRGHNAVSSLIHAAAQQCDHTSEMEVPGLIPGTDLRPADVLTSALGNAYTALDVSICSPHAMAPTWLPSSVRTSPTPRSCGVPMGDLTLTR